MSSSLFTRRLGGARIVAAAIGVAISFGAFQAQAANTITFGSNNNSCGGAVMCSTDGTHGYTNDGTGQAFNLSTINQWFQIDVSGSSEIPGQPVEPDKGAGGFLVLNDTGSAVSSFALTVTDDFTSKTPSVRTCSGAQAGNICDTFSAHGGSGSYKFNTELSGTDWDHCTQGTTQNQTCAGGPGGVATDFAPNSVTYSWTGQNGSTIPAGSYFVVSFSGWNNDGWAYQSPHAYITNANFGGPGTVSVIDTTSNTVIATIPVGAAPQAAAVSPDGGTVYIANSGGNSVSVISTATNTVTATIAVGTYPVDVAVSPDGTRVYVANAYSDNVSVIDPSSDTLIATINVDIGPGGVAVTPDSSKVYVANDTSYTVSVIDASNDTVAKTIPIGWCGTNNVALTPDGSTVYVTNSCANNVSVISTSSNSVTNTIPVGSNPYGVAVSPDGSAVYVANYYDSSLSVIASASNTVIATFNEGGTWPVGVAFTPDGGKIYVANQVSNNVSVIDTASNTVAAIIPVGVNPTSKGFFIQPVH